MNNKEIAKKITDKIIAELENGNIPWIKPWNWQPAYSRSTGKPYNMINQFLLDKPGEWLTFQQAKKEGGKVKKGEKATHILSWIVKKSEVEENENKKEKLSFFKKFTPVFHISQCEGIEPKKEIEFNEDIQPIDRCEKVFTDYLKRENIKLTEGNSAFYSPSDDLIQLPKKGQFEQIENFYQVAFHESAHSTGHKSRLDRLDKLASFGSDEYSKEELVAEISSAILMANMGIDTESTFKNTAGYIQSWIKQLKNDNNLIIEASAKADKAVSLILQS